MEITVEHIKKAEGSTLSPAYFASRDAAQRFMSAFADEHFEPLAKDFAKQFYERVNGDICAFLLSDAENNLQGSMWRQVDDCVKALLGGEQWALEQYALGERYEHEKIRAAVAKHIPVELQDKRVADLEAKVAELTRDLKWHR